ncbi:hypothetical protein SEA_FORZA_45 [Gordonia phage Forza]|uniref:Uncharacterized protein n=1 Tax=Gordonia phage Forza TaxID=2571247 RepID=A0A650EZF0_9CAUD|nr:hypothetical protein PP303_gp045 [Gordonia phage Forza]QEM41515.1 hypothetical protein SEA_BOOPY_46 [Gordonia phage Boopy]QGT55038.1 hypothetical protein SEA_FORZA_45 [Gordonia phage Forza]UXE04188.1 hypothetical protein SEA_BLUENGOLD_44 [Gordonia phage BlueNGold]WBF03827.1 hypothetical protein SEA_MAREELIH_44 [Gordonia phage Mareelih]
MSFFDFIRKMHAEAKAEVEYEQSVNNEARHDREIMFVAMAIAEDSIIKALANSGSFVKCVRCPQEDIFVRDPSGLDAQKEIAQHTIDAHRDGLEEILKAYYIKKNTPSEGENQ